MTPHHTGHTAHSPPLPKHTPTSSHRTTPHCRPYFFLVGEMKCGTTSLYSRIIKHPLIRPPTNKEVSNDWHWALVALTVRNERKTSSSGRGCRITPKAKTLLYTSSKLSPCTKPRPDQTILDRIRPGQAGQVRPHHRTSTTVPYTSLQVRFLTEPKYMKNTGTWYAHNFAGIISAPDEVRAPHPQTKRFIWLGSLYL